MGLLGRDDVDDGARSPPQDAHADGLGVGVGRWSGGSWRTWWTLRTWRTWRTWWTWCLPRLERSLGGTSRVGVGSNVAVDDSGSSGGRPLRIRGCPSERLGIDRVGLGDEMNRRNAEDTSSACKGGEIVFSVKSHRRSDEEVRVVFCRDVERDISSSEIVVDGLVGLESAMRADFYDRHVRQEVERGAYRSRTLDPLQAGGCVKLDNVSTRDDVAARMEKFRRRAGTDVISDAHRLPVPRFGDRGATHEEPEVTGLTS